MLSLILLSYYFLFSSHPIVILFPLSSFCHTISFDDVCLLGSSEAILKVAVQSWNFPPTVPPLTSHNLLLRAPLIIDLKVGDLVAKQFISLQITALPTKGDWCYSRGRLLPLTWFEWSGVAEIRLYCLALSCIVSHIVHCILFFSVRV